MGLPISEEKQGLPQVVTMATASLAATAEYGVAWEVGMAMACGAQATTLAERRARQQA